MLTVAGGLGLVAVVLSVWISQLAVTLDAVTEPMTLTLVLAMAAFIAAVAGCLAVLYAASRQRTRPERPSPEGTVQPPH